VPIGRPARPPLERVRELTTPQPVFPSVYCRRRRRSVVNKREWRPERPVRVRVVATSRRQAGPSERRFAHAPPDSIDPTPPSTRPHQKRQPSQLHARTQRRADNVHAHAHAQSAVAPPHAVRAGRRPPPRIIPRETAELVRRSCVPSM